MYTCPNRGQGTVEGDTEIRPPACVIMHMGSCKSCDERTGTHELVLKLTSQHGDLTPIQLDSTEEEALLKVMPRRLIV